MPKPIDERDFFEAMQQLEYQPAVQLTFTPEEAWVLLANLQLALRHSGNRGRSAAVARRIAQRLQEAVATTPILKKIAEMGWNAANDGPPEERP